MERPKNIVNEKDIAEETFDKGQFASRDLFLGHAAGSVSFGVVKTVLPAGRKSCPEHYHTAEEELFYIIRGEGTLLQNDERVPVSEGDVISYPANAGVSHAFLADRGEDLEYIAVGERDPNDVCVYPRSDKILVRALGKVGRIEEMDYWDGEM